MARAGGTMRRRPKTSPPGPSAGHWAVTPSWSSTVRTACGKRWPSRCGPGPICAGELARGAFEHGEAAYGVDILTRLYDIGSQPGGYLHNCLRGYPESEPKRSFHGLDNRSLMNVGLREGDAEAVWMDQGPNDMRGLPG